MAPAPTYSNGDSLAQFPTATKSSYLVPSILPLGDNVSFEDSSFFTNGNGQLPTPAEVRSTAGSEYCRGRPPPVLFPSLNLIVKYGSEITVAEGQCLWAIRHTLSSIPVPEVYGWRRDNDEIFIYMELVDGITLEQAWPDLDVEEKLDICYQLRPMLEDLRGLRQDPSDTFIGMSFQISLPILLSNIVCIGSINRQSLRDVLFDFSQPAGPFEDSTRFYDWFSQLGGPRPYDTDAPKHPMRPGLPNDPSIVFTHSDLHRSNIIVTKLDSETPRILAIVDWHQSGWYPASWEFFKTRYTCRGQDSWEDEYIFEFLRSHTGTVNWSYFVNGLGI
ncbi:hypothetical protein V494_04012 [Pseudogymnoascus sp. VKM F-4513 (FW-928)]|nr:hypothetical protein V494_04012 [Pseudogymnoascus sp. VKM F-4513 (FW-928)]